MIRCGIRCNSESGLLLSSEMESKRKEVKEQLMEVSAMLYSKLKQLKCELGGPLSSAREGEESATIRPYRLSR